MFRQSFIGLIVISLMLEVLSGQRVKPKESSATKKKKDLTDYSEADLERLYQQWEENDEDELDEDELPAHKRPQKQMDLDSIRAKAKNPEDLLSATKKGQTVMMFVNIRDPSNPTVKNRPYTERTADVFNSMLHNNHMVSQVFLIDDDRAIFMFEDGSQAFEAKNFLLKQEQVTEIILEGQTYIGAGKKKDKDEKEVGQKKEKKEKEADQKKEKKEREGDLKKEKQAKETGQKNEKEASQKKEKKEKEAGEKKDQKEKEAAQKKEKEEKEEL